jgi:hypothetical protein
MGPILTDTAVTAGLLNLSFGADNSEKIWSACMKYHLQYTD